MNFSGFLEIITNNNAEIIIDNMSNLVNLTLFFNHKNTKFQNFRVCTRS